MSTDKKEYGISVIIPCYNVGQYVEETLKSVLNQSFKNYEIICLNDGSTDGTLEILNKYNYPQEKIKRVKNCVLHHRTSFDAENKEEVCVSDADILSHFDNIPMIFDYTYKNYDVNLSNIRSFIKRYFENDYNDLSDKTKVIFKEEYENIMKVLFK